MPPAAPAIPTPAPATASFAASSAEDVAGLRLLVTRLTVALSRRRAYDADHPMVGRADQALLESIRRVLGPGRTLALGVAHKRLLVDGEPFPDGIPAARELADRLHRRSVGAITLRASLTLDGLRNALAWLARQPGPAAPGRSAPPARERRVRYLDAERRVRDGDGPQPTGTDAAPPLDTDRPPPVPDFRITRLPWHHLALQPHADERSRGAHDIWRRLALAALAGHAPGTEAPGAEAPGANAAGATTSGADTAGAGSSDAEAPVGDESLVEPAVLGADLEHAVADPDRAREIGTLLLRFAHEARGLPNPWRTTAANRLRDLLLPLGEGTLAAIVGALEDDADRHRFLATVVDVLPAPAAVDWLDRTAALAGQTCSPHLRQLLATLAARATDGRHGPRVAREFREFAHRLLDAWTIAEPGPVAHQPLLEHTPLAATAPGPWSAGPERAAEAPAPETPTAEPLPPAGQDALRLVQMACELDLVNDEAMAAARWLASAGAHRLLLDVIAAAPGFLAPAALADTVVSADSLRRVLLAEPFDATEARLLLAQARREHAPVLLDALAEARQRSARRLLLGTLRDFGPALLPLLVRQLEPGATWYYLRNVLLLVRELLAVAGPDASERQRAPLFLSYLDHPQVQVRAEALRLALDLPASRSTALLRAFDDASSRIVAIALDALIEFTGEAAQLASVASEAEALAQRLTVMVDEQRFEPEVLARAVRALAVDPSARTRDWLLDLVTRRSRFLRRHQLADGAPTVLAGLRVLARRRDDDPRVEAVLAQARGLEAHDLRRNAVERAHDQVAGLAGGRHASMFDDARPVPASRPAPSTGAAA
jgi:hypothetical protein